MNQRILLSAIDRGSCLWGENIFDDRPCSINANKSENVMSWSTFGEDKSDERYHWSHNDETLIKLLLTGIRIGIWQPFCSYGNLHNRSYSRHSLYLHECVCLFVQKPVCWWLCGCLPALTHNIADSVVWRGDGGEPDTAPPFGSLSTHTHTHSLYKQRQNLI